MICTDKAKIMKALRIQENMKYNHSCKSPCGFLGNFANNIAKDPDPNDGHLLMFKRILERRQSKYIYSITDLLAALGGYLGSFLGASLFHLKDGFAFLVRKAIH